MPTFPTDASPAAWHRFFAIEGNNLAWNRSLQPASEQRNRDLLDAAHASAWHWKVVGSELNHMRATLLLAEVHALVGHGATALAYAETMRTFFHGKQDTPDWETAFVHAIYAHAAHVAGKPELHRSAYALALSAIDAIANEEERKIVLETFRHIPAPA